MWRTKTLIDIKQQRLWVCIVLCCMFGMACGKKSWPVVDGARLALADGVRDKEMLPVVSLLPDITLHIPKTMETFYLAIDKDVLYKDVRAIQKKYNEKQIRFLVTDWHRTIREFSMSSKVSKSTDIISVYAQKDFKVCVSLPRVRESKCVKSYTPTIDRAFVRELFREAVNVSGLTVAKLSVSDDLSWINVVRLVDGIRTCCGQKEIRVDIEND